MSQDNSPPSAAIRRVPIGQTMRAAYAAVFGSLGLLLKAAALPSLLSFAVIGLSFMVGTNPFLSFILTFVGFVPYTLFGVAWHRLTLLGPTEGSPLAFPPWHRRHWRFLGYVAVMTGMIYMIVAPLVIVGANFASGQAQGSPLLLLVIAVIFIPLLPYVMMRLSFVFPAAAVDEAYTLANSWTHTRGQGFRLLVTLFVTAVPMMVVIGFTNWLLGAFLLSDIVGNSQDANLTPESILRQALAEHPVAFSLTQLVLMALSYVVTALMVSAVSTAFRLCTGWVPAVTEHLPNAPRDEDETGSES